MTDVPLFEINWEETDVQNVSESIRRGSHWAKGPFVDQFEAGLAEYFHVEHALVVNSGTTALECALHALEIGPGDEVIVPSFTFIATANVVELVGAEPVFVDIERETLGMDPEDAREKISEDTELILPIHCYGSPCEIESLVDVAAEADIPLLEDAAEGFGAVADGQLVGTFGEAAALSFCQNKVLPTGEGGAVLTDDDEIASTVELFRSHGRKQEEDYFESSESGTYVSVGSNYRMPDVVAALGCSQLENVDSLIAGRQRVANQYNEAFESISGVTPVVGRHTGNDEHVHQLYSILFDEAGARPRVIEELSDNGISSKVYWDPPVHKTQYYIDQTSASLPVTEEISSRVLSLPMFPDMDEETVRNVVEAVSSAIDS